MDGGWHYAGGSGHRHRLRAPLLLRLRGHDREEWMIAVKARRQENEADNALVKMPNNVSDQRASYDALVKSMPRSSRARGNRKGCCCPGSAALLRPLSSDRARPTPTSLSRGRGPVGGECWGDQGQAGLGSVARALKLEGRAQIRLGCVCGERHWIPIRRVDGHQLPW